MIIHVMPKLFLGLVIHITGFWIWMTAEVIQVSTLDTPGNDATADFTLFAIESHYFTIFGGLQNTQQTKR